jgi:hypothetical protein
MVCFSLDGVLTKKQSCREALMYSDFGVCVPSQEGLAQATEVEVYLEIYNFSFSMISTVSHPRGFQVSPKWEGDHSYALSHFSLSYLLQTHRTHRGSESDLFVSKGRLIRSLEYKSGTKA